MLLKSQCVDYVLKEFGLPSPFETYSSFAPLILNIQPSKYPSPQNSLQLD